MTRKKDDKPDKDKAGLNKLSQLMLDQNESLRKLLEELSRKEKKNNKIYVDTNKTNNSN